MKKHDEGYALAFVLVVVTVLCLVALSMMSIALQNMRSEQVTVTRMQEKYAAQGEIEKVVARFENSIQALEGQPTRLFAFDEKAVQEFCMELDEEGNAVSFAQVEEFAYVQKNADLKSDYLSVTLAVGDAESPTIRCTIHISGDIQSTGFGESGQMQFNVDNVVWKYASYTIYNVADATPQGGAADE